MAEPRVFRTEALVLKGFDYGEADRILTLLTPGRGKLSAVAKGIRRTRSRKAGHLDLFTRSALMLARGRNLDIITQAETVESFRPMREGLGRSSFAHYVAELLDGFAVEGQAGVAVYSLAVATFRQLATAGDLDLATRAFEMQLLGLMGYQPQLRQCLECAQSIEPLVNRFSVRLGGVLCPDCGAADPPAPEISVSALKMLRNLQNNREAVLALAQTHGEIAVNGYSGVKKSSLDQTVHREVEARLREYIAFRLERAPRSAGFLDRLRAEAALG